MRVFIGFDDTDTVEAAYGTGKVARGFEESLPDNCRLDGVVRQQLLVDARIPYTSHNSAACMIILVPEPAAVDSLTTAAIAHLETHALSGSDPGVCVACEKDASIQRLMDFGRDCTRRVVTQKEAVSAAKGSHLSGHGGTDDGIIGAAAAVGLTASGWCGRFIEFDRLRSISDVVTVLELERRNMQVISLDRDAAVPAPGDLVHTKGWLRPRLLGGKAVVMATPKGKGVWESVGEKRKGPEKSIKISGILP